MERGQADRVAVHVLVRVAAALGARIDLRLLWQGEGLDRLLDAGHAELVERTLELLADKDWLVATEVSFNVRGERGSIDVVAFHPASGSLLVIEIKSVVPDMQAMLGGIDRKGLLGRDIASERGWRVKTVTRLLVLPDERTARRRVEGHGATFRTALRRDGRGPTLDPGPEGHHGWSALSVRCTPNERSSPGREPTTVKPSALKRGERAPFGVIVPNAHEPASPSAAR